MYTLLVGIFVNFQSLLYLSCFQALADYAPELECVRISNCTRVSHEGLRYLMDNAPKINSLDLSYLSVSSTLDGLNMNAYIIIFLVMLLNDKLNDII